MRILFIDVNCKQGSTGNIVYNLHKKCKDNGIISSVCYGRGKKIRENNIFKFGLDFETYIHAFLTRITGFTGSFSFFSTIRLIRYIKKFHPDIVHIHELHAYFVNVIQLLRFLKKKQIKVIFTNHCEFLYTGKCGHSRECNRYSEKCGKCPHLKEYPASWFFDHTSYMLRKKKSVFLDWENCFFVSPSKWLDSKLNTSFLHYKKRYVINNGIDTDAFAVDSESPNANKEKIVLSVAPNIMSELKGGYRVLELAKKYEHDSVRFILVGSTSNVPTDVPPNVTILPLISDRKELIKYYKNSDLFLICSSFENFPTTSLEAQCCGLPVCGFNVGGVSETILSGNGSVVDYNDLTKMKDQIDHYLSLKIDKRSISLRSISAFSNDRMFNDYLNLYKQIL